MRVSTTNPFADGVVVDRLRALHEHYIDAVNRAVAEERYDLVADLVADYPDEALTVMAPWAGEPIEQPRTVGRRRRTGFRYRLARWVAAIR